MVMVVLKSKSSFASKVMHISINRRTSDTANTQRQGTARLCAELED